MQVDQLDVGQHQHLRAGLPAPGRPPSGRPGRSGPARGDPRPRCAPTSGPASPGCGPPPSSPSRPTLSGPPPGRSAPAWERPRPRCVPTRPDRAGLTCQDALCRRPAAWLAAGHRPGSAGQVGGCRGWRLAAEPIASSRPGGPVGGGGRCRTRGAAGRGGVAIRRAAADEPGRDGEPGPDPGGGGGAPGLALGGLDAGPGRGPDPGGGRPRRAGGAGRRGARPVQRDRLRAATDAPAHRADPAGRRGGGVDHPDPAGNRRASGSRMASCQALSLAAPSAGARCCTSRC